MQEHTLVEIQKLVIRFRAWIQYVNMYKQTGEEIKNIRSKRPYRDQANLKMHQILRNENKT